jgi:ubiquinone/menaquinone biosynthesis C-methylase UbiE
MNYLNLGCGKRYHRSWTNIDFKAIGEDVIGHNLLNGIPFEDKSFDAVYHSHVLEHFSKNDGLAFIRECFRVIRIGGVIRIAVPDLERIVLEYQLNLKRALNSDFLAADDYDWSMLELYDQVVRNHSGGDMAKFIFQEKISNEKYVFERIGEEAKQIRQHYFNQKPIITDVTLANSKRKISVKKFVMNKLKDLLFKTELKKNQELNEIIKIGKFRLGGEIHQWMYDRYSLGRLLKEVGFSDVSVCSAFESRTPNWNNYELESSNGIVFKPDSLFMEAVKLK